MMKNKAKSGDDHPSSNKKSYHYDPPQKKTKANGEIKGRSTSLDVTNKARSLETFDLFRSPSEKPKASGNKRSSNPYAKGANKNIENGNTTKSRPEKYNKYSSENVSTSSSDRSRTKNTRETVSQNGSVKHNVSKRKRKESSTPSSKSRSHSSARHNSSHDPDLEEKLPHRDPDFDHEGDEDFFEERHLLESDEEFTLKGKGKVGSKNSVNKKILENKEKLPANKTNKGSTERKGKKIEKILNNLSNALENKNKNSGSTTFRKIDPNKNNLKLSSNCAEKNLKSPDGDGVKGRGSNKRKFSDTNPPNSNSLVKRKLPDDSNSSNLKNNGKRRLSEPSNLGGNNSLVKAKIPDSNCHSDGNNLNKSVKANSKIDISKSKGGKTSVNTSKTKPNIQSEKNSSKAEISFSEALKSIAMEDNLYKSIAMEDNLLHGKPQVLVPTTELTSSDTITPLSSSLTLLQPISRMRSNSSSAIGSAPAPVTDFVNDNQGRKRSLPGNFESLNPNLKRIRYCKDAEKTISFTERNSLQGETSSRQEVPQNINNFGHSYMPENKESHVLNNGADNDDRDVIDRMNLQIETLEENHNNLITNSKLRRIKRKDLESVILELFVDKVLYEHHLGQRNDLCKRLETTLESTRKKAAQFHKEIEDLKKVTHRLQAEHLARKSQLVAPVKIKRSVGVQATPTIISKGIMNVTAHSMNRVLTPTTTMSPSSESNSNKSQVSKVIDIEPLSSNCTSSSPSLSSTPRAPVLAKPPKPRIKPQVLNTNINNRNKSTQQLSAISSTKTVNLSGHQPNPGTQVTTAPFVVQSQNGSVASQFIPVTTARVVRAPLTPVNSSGTSFSSSSLPSSATGVSIAVAAPSTSASSFIDLTDDDEAAKTQRTSLQASGLVAIQRTASTGVNINRNTSGQFVTLNPPTSVGQILLVPTPNGQTTTALVVGGVANTSSASGVVRTAINQNPGVRVSSPVSVVQPTRAAGAQMNGGGTFVNKASRHPAALPRAPPQQTSGYSKKLPPLPTLKLSHKDNSIILSWNMAKTDEHELIASYQIFAYQEGTSAPTTALWKKVGSVKALELPMACTLTQFMPGHVYHFAVRAIDIRSRLGPFSDPKSILLAN